MFSAMFGSFSYFYIFEIVFQLFHQFEMLKVYVEYGI